MIEVRRKQLWVAGLVALLALPGGARAQLNRLPPLSDLKLSHVTERLVVVDKAPYRMYALRTSAGLVFIDTEPTPALTRQAIAMVQKEFKQKDVAWLIYSHDHLDHLLGHAAFAGTAILATEGTARGIVESQPQMKGYLEQAEQTLAKARAERDSL